jgi:hypothetical protein
MRPSERLSRIPPYLQPAGGGQALPQNPLPESVWHETE